MAHFDPGPPPQKVTPQWMRGLLDRLKTSINYLDVTNFTNNVSGSIIASGTLSGSALINQTVNMSALKWLEWPIPLVLPSSAVSTTSTAGLNLGGYFLWNPSTYPGGDWYLEASLVISNAAGIATCVLTGAADIGTATTQSTSLTLVRSSKLTMPATAQNLWVILKTNNASYTASLASARLIFVPS